MQAVYSLEKDPITWDFGVFLVGVMTQGCTHVVFTGHKFGTGKFKGNGKIAERRFNNILVGLCELAGVTWERKDEADGIRAGLHAGDLNRLYQKEGRIWKFKPTKDDGRRGYVTVTIRDSFRNRCRNSQRSEWDRVIETLRKTKEVVVLEDMEQNPMSVIDRMNLYAFADMNYAVNNGPNVLNTCSENPYRIFNWIPRVDEDRIWEKNTKSGGFPKGSQLLFKNDNQRIVWEHDDYDVIMRNL